MKILITGGAGFIGSHTANRLAELGHEITIFDNLLEQVHGQEALFPNHLKESIIKIKGDIRDYQALSVAVENQDIIYHFAALTGVGQSLYQIKEYIDVNVTGTATLIQAIIHSKNKPKKVILSSSRAVYGEGNYQCKKDNLQFSHPRSKVDLENGLFNINCPLCNKALSEISVSENRALNPLSVYAETKKSQEDYLKHFSNLYSIPVTILRYFNVYGSQQSLNNPYTGILTVFYNQIQNGQKINIYEKGIPTRDFVHVNDVAKANLLALKVKHKGAEIFNIGTGENLKIKNVAEQLMMACKKKSDLEETAIYRLGDILSCTANLEKSNKILGYHPTITIEQGLQEFVTWAKKQNSQDRYAETFTELSKHNLIGEALCLAN